MAKEAGLRTVFVKQGHSREHPTEEPDAHIASIAELPAAVARLTTL
jgi:FMN phosphatase YigB (HAD superfamily)